MEPKKLPNVTIALVLVIFSFLCCCIGGLPALLFSGIAFFLLRKDEKAYAENPDLYSNFSTLKTIKILAIVGMVVGILYFAYTLWSIDQMGGWDGYMEKVQDAMEQYQ
ncbi:CCC motif membrane protein [uncultured Croceitalea sp.]|uniref:CCC motif membrane protein n=1 Tax=uncultured Croceitalea sp. TaxID=1798908 RepID=UPI0033061F44